METVITVADEDIDNGSVVRKKGIETNKNATEQTTGERERNY